MSPEEVSVSSLSSFRIGNAQNTAGGSGCTVILCEKGAVAGVDVRGGAPASHETELLHPVNTIDRIHAVVLSGGSAFGLEATAGVMQFLEEKGVGFSVGPITVPIVCGASLFDLTVGDSRCRPDKAMGYEACRAAYRETPAEGNFGAGTGATVGKWLGPERSMKSGLGIVAVRAGALIVAAVAAVNAVGDVVDAETGAPLAGLLSPDGYRRESTADALLAGAPPLTAAGANTTLVCILTNASLTKAQASKAASMAHNGLARTIRPAHTTMDGDTVFCMADGSVSSSVDLTGSLAAYATAKAINRAVIHAESAYGLKSYRDLFP